MIGAAVVFAINVFTMLLEDCAGSGHKLREAQMVVNGCDIEVTGRCQPDDGSDSCVCPGGKMQGLPSASLAHSVSCSVECGCFNFNVSPAPFHTYVPRHGKLPWRLAVDMQGVILCRLFQGRPVLKAQTLMPSKDAGS